MQNMCKIEASTGQKKVLPSPTEGFPLAFLSAECGRANVIVIGHFGQVLPACPPSFPLAKKCLAGQI